MQIIVYNSIEINIAWCYPSEWKLSPLSVNSGYSYNIYLNLDDTVIEATVGSSGGRGVF